MSEVGLSCRNSQRVECLSQGLQERVFLMSCTVYMAYGMISSSDIHATSITVVGANIQNHLTENLGSE